MTRTFNKSDIAREYIRRFPNAPAKTLATKAYKENPEVWPTLEACRSACRRVLGQSGELSRHQTAPDSFRASRKPGNPFGEIPEGLTSLEDWKPLTFTGAYTAAIVCDVHTPYHAKQALELALDKARERACNLLVWNGDFLDCFSLSRWEQDPRKRDFRQELDTAKRVLDIARAAFPDARMVLKLGNHEERYERYMRCKAPELLDVADFELDKLLRSEDYGLEVVRNKQPIRLGKLWILHGHEYRFQISNPVNPARGLYLRSHANCVVGHFHQASQHSEKDLEGKVTSCWSVGCLCDMHPDWMPLNKWSHGVMIIEVDEHGSFQVENYRILDGKIWR